MKRIKRTFTQEEKDLVYDLWKQGAGFSDIGRVIEAKPGSVFTVLRETGGIKPRQRTRNITHLTSEEREEIRAALSAKMSIRAIARLLDRSPSTITSELFFVILWNNRNSYFVQGLTTRSCFIRLFNSFPNGSYHDHEGLNVSSPCVWILLWLFLPYGWHFPLDTVNCIYLHKNNFGFFCWLQQ